MVLQLSHEQARRLLASYHFTSTDLPGVFARLGTVQYDPLNPVGRNPDLVLQARVPGYRVNDWQALAYEQRLIYDAWDKMACLVPISDWPMRALIRERHRPYHDHEILLKETAAVEAILAALDTRGPLSSLEFEKKTGYDPNSWSGQTQAKRILRALWVSGDLVTHHRRGGRHYYDRSQRVIPTQHFNQPPLLDEDAYFRWIVTRRYQAMGLLRPASTEAAIWYACGKADQRKKALNELVEEGTVVPVQIGEKKLLFYAYAEALKLLDQPPLEPRAIFLGPLDSFLWDRKGVQQIFDFDYTWEVYKPEHLRQWGYYVLPVFYGDRFIARLDSRLEKGIWTIARWWWEDGIAPDAEMLDALHAAMQSFLVYLGAEGAQASEGVDEVVRNMIACL